MNPEKWDTIVIGGGFYGAMIALQARERGRKTLLLEASSQLLSRASAVNQARVHSGYHYPRSFLTATRSRVLQQRFLSDFPECRYGDFTSLYGVAARGSLITADHFEGFCTRAGASLRSPPNEMRALFRQEEIAGLWLVDEVCFDVAILRSVLSQRLKRAGVEVRLGVAAESLRLHEEGALCLRTASQDLWSAQVFVAAYSGTNSFLEKAGLPLLELRQELTEMSLVQMPPALRHLGVTMMDGPFWSVLPYPSRPGLHTLSHVRYTPNSAWTEGPLQPEGVQRTERVDRFMAEGRLPQSQHRYMVQDAQRFVPSLQALPSSESIWEIKTVLPKSDLTDSRPILYRPNYAGTTGLHLVIGAKIDNIYDLLDELEHNGLWRS